MYLSFKVKRKYYSITIKLHFFVISFFDKLFLVAWLKFQDGFTDEIPISATKHISGIMIRKY